MQSDVTQFLVNTQSFNKLYINKDNILRWNLDNNDKLTIEINITDMKTMKNIVMSIINLDKVNVNFNTFEQFLFEGIRLDKTTFYVTNFTLSFEPLIIIPNIISCDILELDQQVNFREFFGEGITIQDLQVYNNEELVTFRFYFLIGVNPIQDIYTQNLSVAHITSNRKNKTFYFKEGSYDNV